MCIRRFRRSMKTFFCTTFFLCLLALSAAAQTTEFTYQGRLVDGSVAANGNYDLEFALYDAMADGTQIGAGLTRTNVLVSNGTFSVSLDFGNVFSGTELYLEIHVRRSGSPTFTPLAPRQKLSSVPYAVKSLNADNAATATNAAQLGGVASDQFVVTGDTRLSDARPPTAGSANYIQNGTATQPSSDFNISGNGTAGGTLSGSVVNAQTQFNLNGQRLIATQGFSLFIGSGNGATNTGSFNTFVGTLTGSQNTSGQSNSFFGYHVGTNNTTGLQNAFFGTASGFANTTGYNNSYFGASAGVFSTGNNNSFFGQESGRAGSAGSNNSFFGQRAGFAGNNNSIFGQEAGTATTGDSNSFFGRSAGRVNLAGFSNSFFGESAGYANSGGNYNSFFGQSAGLNNTQGSFNTYVGALAGAQNDSANYNSFFGYGAGNKTTEQLNAFFGYTSGLNNTSGLDNAFYGAETGATLVTGSSTSLFGFHSDVGSPDITNATAIGANALAGEPNALVLGSIKDINFANFDAAVGIGTTTPSNLAGTSARLSILQRSSGHWTQHIATNNFTAGNSFGLLIDAGTNGSDDALRIRSQDGASQLFSVKGNGMVGIGTANPGYKLEVSGTTPNAFATHIYTTGLATATSYGLVISAGTDVTDSALQVRNQAGINIMRINGAGKTSIGMGTTPTNEDLTVATARIVLGLYLGVVAGGGTTQLCLNGSQVALCNSSSARYKTNIDDFRSGLDLVRGLRPVTFDWRSNGTHDFGLIAEDVAKVVPDLAFYHNGQIEGVKYDKISVVLINAVKEQQAQIEDQKKDIERLESANREQQVLIADLRALVCARNRRAKVCQKR